MYLIEYDLNGSSIHIEVEKFEYQKKSPNNDKTIIQKSEKSFKDSIAKIKPVAEAILESFNQINTPDEINIEFGIKFDADAGVVIASSDSASTFKVSLRWEQ